MMMAKSTITVTYQTTVPKGVREKLGVGPSDILNWNVVGDQVRVTASTPAFLEREGRIKVGPGDPVEDVRRARELLATSTLMISSPAVLNPAPV